ncbi:hypothetical protein EIQ02_22050 [Xanthomonas campestris pv. raphani]
MHCLHPAHRPSRLALARPPSRDLTRHGCRVRALQGRTCSVSRDGGRARALQPSSRPAAPHLISHYRTCSVRPMVGGRGPFSRATDRLLFARQARVLLDKQAEQTRALSTRPG